MGCLAEQGWSGLSPKLDSHLPEFNLLLSVGQRVSSTVPFPRFDFPGDLSKSCLWGLLSGPRHLSRNLGPSEAFCCHSTNPVVQSWDSAALVWGQLDVVGVLSQPLTSCGFILSLAEPHFPICKMGPIVGILTTLEGAMTPQQRLALTAQTGILSVCSSTHSLTFASTPSSA